MSSGTKTAPPPAGGAVGSEAINTCIITLTRFLTEEQSKHPEASGEFTSVNASLQFLSCY